MLPLKNSKHKDEICEEYGNIEKPYLQTKIMKGYKSSKWDDKNLAYKIRVNKISNKKSNYTNEYFEAIHLTGLLPAVKEMIEEL